MSLQGNLLYEIYFQTLVICLRDKHVPAQNLPVELLRRKADLCKELVDVLKILSPGVSRLTGNILRY